MVTINCDFCGKITNDTDELFLEDVDINDPEVFADIRSDVLAEHELDCPNQDLFPIKFLVEGVDDLTEAAKVIKSFGEELERKGNDGWKLLQPVDNGHLRMAKVE